VPPAQLKPAPLVTGKDLIAEGYRPGPMFGIVLSEIEDAQLEGRISNRADAMAMARERLEYTRV
jgi:poly(A) polymerase